MCPQISVKTPNMKFHENPSYNSRCFGIRMARRTQMTKTMFFFWPIVPEPTEQFSNTHYFFNFNFLFAAYRNEVLLWYNIGQYHNLEVNSRNKNKILIEKLNPFLNMEISPYCFAFCTIPYLLIYSKGPESFLRS